MINAVAKDPDIVHSGPPPFVGWWNAFIEEPNRNKWRFWDGIGWSLAVRPESSPEHINRWAEYRTSRKKSSEVKWTWYYPENARVPRIPIYCVHLDGDGELIEDFSNIYDGVRK